MAQLFAVTEKNELVLVRQYIHGAGNFLLELPADNFNSEEESPECAAIRELREETGYIAKEK